MSAKQQKSNTKTAKAKNLPATLLTISLCALIIVLLSSLWVFYCIYISHYELSDKSEAFSFFCILFFLAASAIVNVGWILIGLLALIAIVICIADYQKSKHKLQLSVIVKHLIFTMIALLPRLLF